MNASQRFVPSRWEYRGQHVGFLSDSTIPDILKPDGEGAGLVQYALGRAPDLTQARAIWSVRVPSMQMPPLAVAVGNLQRIWAFSAAYTGSHHELVPFVQIPEHEQPVTDVITVALKTMPRGRLAITRAHFGAAVPPFPWRRYAVKRSKIGAAGCRAYWETHAYLLSPFNGIVPGSVSTEPPRWWQRHSR